MSNIDKLKKYLNTDLKDYKSIPFWSWNNKLSADKLVQQIEEMKSAGIGGFIIHARTGLKTEYLSDEWFYCVEKCLNKAKELNMKAWIYDENGWPSGFVGGKLLENEEYRARYLEYNVTSSFDETAYCVFIEDNDEFIRVSSNVSTNRYHNIYLRVSPANTDILNTKVVEKFVDLTHKEYYNRFKDSFGKELVGFFTDEPQYYRYATPFSNEIFKEINEEEVLNNLIYLFIKNEKGYSFRIKYYTALNKLYVNNYYKILYDWCEEHGCKLTGHSIEEGALHAQMYGGGNVMTTYEYEHIPAVDWLGRDCGNELSPKQVSSVCAQLGIKQILTETFACGGYDTTPKELKSIGEFQYFNGVNMMCHHLYPYSIAGQGKHDHPPFFSKHSNWFDEFKEFNEYFDKLGYIIANTKERFDVGIIHPMNNVYLDYIRTEDYLSVKKLEDDFNELLNKLRINGVMYQLIDETILSKYGKVVNNNLVVGNCEYQTIIVPKMKSIFKSTYDILKEFNGELLVLENIEYIDGVYQKVNLNSNITFNTIVNKRNFDVNFNNNHTIMTSRFSEVGDFIFIKNLSRFSESNVDLQSLQYHYRKIDLNNMKSESISRYVKLDKSESIILLKEEDYVKIEDDKSIVETDITNNFKVWSMGENYLVLDYGFLSFDGINYQDKKPLQAIFDELLRMNYCGNVYIKQYFKANNYLNLKLIMEDCSFDEVFVNNHLVNFKTTTFDFNFYESDITKHVRIGENEIVYRLNFYQHDGVNFALFDPLATESVRNCLFFDKSIENGYLRGRFIIEEDFSLSKLEKYPRINDNIINCGYPFFKGEITFKGSYNYDNIDSDILISIDGRYQVCNLVVNKKKINLVFENEVSIKDYLHKGNNDIFITIKSSLRNLFGPHHVLSCPEPTGVFPGLFTYRTQWKNGYPSNYTDKYNSVFFGVNNIKIKRVL